MVYEKFEPGEPGLFRNAVRQLTVVLVNVPDELMYWPRLLRIATWACGDLLVVLDPAADEDLGRR